MKTSEPAAGAVLLVLASWCLHVAHASLGMVALVNSLPTPVRVTVAYNFTSHLTTDEDPLPRTVSDIRVEDALMSPGQARDWSLGLYESATWEVINIRVEPLPSQVMSLRPTRSDSDVPLVRPVASPISSSSFHAPPRLLLGAFPYESGCDPSSSARLSISYETITATTADVQPHHHIILVKQQSPASPSPSSPAPASTPSINSNNAVGGLSSPSTDAAAAAMAAATVSPAAAAVVVAQKTVPMVKKVGEVDGSTSSSSEAAAAVAVPKKDSAGQDGGNNRRLRVA